MRRRTWETVQVVTPAGPVEAAAPVIVSASRATDIPAHYGEWLLRRLRAGWCARLNRFSGRRDYVSFERARVIVFWSKNPAPLIPRLGEIDALGINHAFTFTLNDYEREGLEPGLPPLEERMGTFLRLSALLGPDRVVWRFDPILVGRRLTPEAILERIARIGARVHRHTRTLVISFADIAAYPAARRRMGETGRGEYREPAPGEIERIAAGIRDLNRGWGLEVGACAERVELTRWGIGPNRCVDDRLMARAFSGDAALLEFLGRGAESAAAPRGSSRRGIGGAPAAHPLKDRGQRPACGCIVSRDIGRYGTCPQGCAYCYANVSHAAAAAAHARHDPDAECL